MDIWEVIREELRQQPTSFEFLNNIGEAMKMHPKFDVDCLSKGQLYSKVWLVKELKKISPYYGNICLLGGWYSIGADMLFKNMNVNKIHSYDLDVEACVIADEVNINYVIDNWKFKAFVKDINEVDYKEYNTIINTSSEHMVETTWFDNIPEERLVAIQSNNLSLEEHINCVTNIEELKEKFKLSRIYFQGELDLIDFKRFMIIGKK